MAALAEGTLALQRQITAMKAAHAAELKDAWESHAAELADVKARAVTRIKELQAEVIRPYFCWKTFFFHILPYVGYVPTRKTETQAEVIRLFFC